MHFRKNEASYQLLLKSARNILKERLHIATDPILAHDLISRDRLFTPPKQKGINAIQALDAAEEQMLLQIQDFLMYAVDRGDMRRAPLVGSSLSVLGFAFVK